MIFNYFHIFLIVVAFILVITLTYNGAFVLNEEVLVAITFVLFITLIVILFTDVIKASLFSRLISIKNKFYDLQLNIRKEIVEDYKSQLNTNIFNEIPLLVDIDTKEIDLSWYNFVSNDILEILSLNNEEQQIIDEELEFSLITNIIDNKVEENLITSREFIELYNIIYLNLYFDYWLTQQDEKIVESNNNKIFNMILEYIRYREYHAANINFRNIAKHTFLTYAENLSINKQYLDEIMK